MRNKLLLLLFAIMFLPSSAMAAHWFQAGTSQGHNNEVNCDSTMDCNQQSGKMEIGVDPSPTFTGDVTFQSTLISTGRVNGASTVASSSTNLAPANLPYVFLEKGIGGSDFDDTDGGTRLQNGTDGQILSIRIVGISSGASDQWVVTPTTSSGFDSLTFDAVNESVTLLYVNSTVGWVITAHDGVTITYQPTAMP